MKKENAFTLIELLAIIVILAIIAVITIPIILNIIDNAQRGAAKDSAYGYKDAINKYYLSKSVNENDFDIPNETYTVSGTTGYLVGTQTLEIKISGKIPDGGAVEMYNNEIKQACLIFGDYAVSINNDKVGDAIKGTCNGTIVESNNSIISIYAHKGDSQKKSVENIAVGDYVTIKDDGFYVIAEPSNGNVLLLSEYNITTSPVWGQKNSDNFEEVPFSESKYWDNHIATVSDPNDCPSETYCNRYDYETEEWVYIYDSASNLSGPIEEYKSYLQTIIGTNNITDIRLISYSEANSIIDKSWSHNQQYWIGSMPTTSNDALNMVGYVYADNYISYIDTMNYTAENSTPLSHGIRPVVEISTNTFGNNQVAIYAQKGDSQTKSSSNIEVGDYVKIGNDGFYVIKQPSNNKVLLLPEYNISKIVPLSETAEWRQTGDSDYAKIKFSDSSYWISNIGESHNYVATVSDPTTCPQNHYCNLYPNEEAIYIYDSHSTLYNPIMNYKSYLDSILGSETIANIRPMAYYEANSVKSNSWSHNQAYWLGSGGHRGSNLYTNVETMNSQGNIEVLNYQQTTGVRPVIEIPLSVF